MENSDQQNKLVLQKLLIELRKCRMEMKEIHTKLSIGTGNSHNIDVLSAVPQELKQRLKQTLELIEVRLGLSESIQKLKTSGTSSKDD